MQLQITKSKKIQN